VDEDDLLSLVEKTRNQKVSVPAAKRRNINLRLPVSVIGSGVTRLKLSVQ
jgi:hypothetical protein